MNVQNYLKRCQKRVETSLKELLPSPNRQPRPLNQAMRYAVLSGGKRLRAALIFATGESMGAKSAILGNVGAAVEMVHAYSLIHDDLPALDNDDLRRGKPTCHKAFGEATAILAGDALQSLSFEILSHLPSHDLSPKVELKMIETLTQAIGSAGMIGGEELDLEMVNQKVSLKQLETMYRLKTGCLLEASLTLGALAANCQDKKILQNLSKFGKYIGLAFQIHDDIIGIESDTKTLGKTQGNDLALNKPVYPVVVGMARAKKKERMLYRKALSYLDKLNGLGFNTDKLKAIAAYIIERSY